MKATSIPAHEAGFFATGVDSLGKKFIFTPLTVTIPGEQIDVDMVSCVRDNGDESFFFKEEIAKTQIVLHFTAGYLKGDVATLTQSGNHVSVPFIIARNGIILNMWTSKFWSFHLGKGASGGNTVMSQKTIGIEISNIGPLRKFGNNIVTTFRNDDVYCDVTETSFYAEQNYRDEKFFASYTNAQYESIIKLLRLLTVKNNIPRTFIEEAKRFDRIETMAAFSGISSHVNYRLDKWDIGPGAFDWNRVIAGVTA